MDATPPSCASASSTPMGGSAKAAGRSRSSPSLTREPDLVDDERGWRRTATRVARHVRWARQGGVARLAEEDDLNPVDRTMRALRRWRWRQRHAVATGTAAPVWLVGVQRSGT